MAVPVDVCPREAIDQAAVSPFLARHHSLRVARLGELLHPLDHPAFVAKSGDDRPLGVLTYVPDDARRNCEVLTLHTDEQWHGIGTALLEAVERWAAGQGYACLWLITTNDNADALRFYQRRGFHLTDLYPDAVSRSRTRLKPEIPLTGTYDIPLRDEIRLEKPLP